MKKSLYILTLILISLHALAQDRDYVVNDAKLTVGIREGLTVANMPRNATGTGSITSGSVLTWSAGAYTDYKFDKSLSVQAGLFYVGNGGSNKINNSGNNINADTKTYLHYLQLPVNMVYRVHVGINSIYFGVGPYAEYGIYGKTTGTLNTLVNGKTKQKTLNEGINFGNGSADVKRIDYGIDPIAGFQFYNGILINATYNLGFNNINNANTFSYQGVTSSAKNRSFNLSIGIAF